MFVNTDNPFMSVKAKIWSALRTANRPMSMSELAKEIYGRSTPATRNRLAVTIHQMNEHGKMIHSAGRGSAAKGYWLARTDEGKRAA